MNTIKKMFSSSSSSSSYASSSQNDNPAAENRLRDLLQMILKNHFSSDEIDSCKLEIVDLAKTCNFDALDLSLLECLEAILDGCEENFVSAERRAVVSRLKTRLFKTHTVSMKLKNNGKRDIDVEALTGWYYDGRWKSCNDFENHAYEEKPWQHMKIISFNVWFDRFASRERFEAFEQMVIKEKPQIVCVQESTVRFMAWLCDSEYVQQNYCMSDLNGETFARWCFYGAVILWKRASFFKVHQLSTLILPTQYGRKAIVLQIQPFGLEEHINITTVHLESLSSRPTRYIQLQVIENYTTANENNIVCGDFNFDSLTNYHTEPELPLENTYLSETLPNYIDCWPLLRPNERGLTFDSLKNDMIMATAPQHVEERKRYDRFMIRASSVQPKSIALKGHKSFGELEGTKLFTSDHFGLCLKIEMKNKKTIEEREDDDNDNDDDDDNDDDNDDDDEKVENEAKPEATESTKKRRKKIKH